MRILHGRPPGPTMPPMAAAGTGCEHTVERESQAARPNRVHGVTLLALALAFGIAIGAHAGPLVWPWLGAAAGALLSALAIKGLATVGPFLAKWLLAAAAIALGAARVAMQQHYTAPSDLAAHAGDEQMLLRLRGVATAPPELRLRTTGSMAGSITASLRHTSRCASRHCWIAMEQRLRSPEKPT